MTPEIYLQEVRSLVDSIRSNLSENEVLEVEHLIDHDEPVEGLRTLAWIIHDEGIVISANTAETILRLIGDFLPENDLPPHFGVELIPQRPTAYPTNLPPNS